MDITKEKDGSGFWDYLVILLVIVSMGIITIIAFDFFSSESVSQDSFEEGYWELYSVTPDINSSCIKWEISGAFAFCTEYEKSIETYVWAKSSLKPQSDNGVEKE